jgi:hypothetical protein
VLIATAEARLPQHERKQKEKKKDFDFVSVVVTHFFYLFFLLPASYKPKTFGYSTPHPKVETLNLSPDGRFHFEITALVHPPTPPC